MSHYYITDESLSKEMIEINTELLGNNFILYTQSGVFSKDNIDFGTKLLIESLKLEKSDKKIVDIGCGYGPIGLSVAKANSESFVYMFDINERAINLAKLNARKNKVDNVDINLKDFTESKLDNVDVIITNPPIRTGKKNIFSIYENSYASLRSGGKFFCVIQKKQGAVSTRNKLMELFGNSELINRKKGYWILMSIKK